MDDSPNPRARRAAEDDRRTIDDGPLARFVVRQRWYAGKSRAPGRARVAEFVGIPGLADGSRGYLAIVEVETAGAAPERYLVPVVAAAESAVREVVDRWVIGPS